MGKMRARRVPSFHILDFGRFPPSVERLPAALTINGITVLPTFRYNGKDANATNWPAWGYGETLTLQAGTAPTYNNGSPLLGSVDDSVKFNAGGYYKASGSTGNIATEDFVFEAIYNKDTAGRLFWLYDGSHGWLMFNTATAIRFDLCGASATANGTTSVITANTWNHFIIFVDRSGSMQPYLNGVAITGDFPVIVSGAGSIISTATMEIGSNATNPIAYLAMWQGASWLDTHLQATVAKTRFAQLTGVYPQQARGTALPTVMARTTAGYLDKIEADGSTKLYYVGANWPRVCSRKDTNGNVVRGYLSETAATNYCDYSRTFTSWPTEGSPTRTVGQLGPDGTTGASLIAGITAAGGTTIYVASTVGAGANGTVVNGSIWFKRVTTTGVLNIDSANGVAFGRYTVDLSTLPDAWVRLGPQSPYVTVVAPHITWDGTGRTGMWLNRNSGASALSFYVDFAQITVGTLTVSEVPNVSTSPTTRTADSLRYKMDDGNLTAGKGSLVLDFMGANVDILVGTGWYTAILSDGTASKRIALSSYITGVDESTFFITATELQSQIQGTTDIWNGNKHTIRATWKTNDARQYVDGAADGTPDVACTIPTGLTQLDVGAYLSAGYECNGIVSNLKILPKPSKSD